VTISLGIAAADKQAATSPEELINAADAALYQAKRGGRNRCVMAVAECVGHEATR
jgi:diguanylate cyclase